MKKHYFYISTIFVLFLSVFVAKASTDNSVIYSINDLYNNIDYKPVATFTDADAEALDLDKSMWVDNIPNRNLDNTSIEESWLIRNEIVSRPFTLHNNEVDLRIIDDSDYCTKSLLYMMLYKSYYGVLNSRTVVFTEADVNNVNDEEHEISNNYALFNSANVYELYFKELLDAGLLDKGAFNDKNGAKFLQDYDTLCNVNVTDTNVPWSNQVGLVNANQMNALGYSYNYVQGEFIFGINEELPNYFSVEKLYTKDALNIIADYVRRSEKDMSNLESSAIAYKYGLQYLRNLNEDDRRSIEYLIAKGILNFEDPNEFINLYGNFTYEDACKIIYRVANPDARLNFSELTLTDSESFWMDKGFFRDSMDIQIVSDLPIAETITSDYWNEIVGNDKNYIAPDFEENNKPVNDTFINDILGLLNGKVAYAADTKKYTVIKMFNTAYAYNYKGIPIEDLQGSDKCPAEFVSFEKKTINSVIPGDGAGNSVIMAKVTFSVEAKDYDTAILFVDNNITIDNSIDNPDINCFTMLESDGVETTLIPATTIKNAGLDIGIIEDKVLVNNVTGVTAILLPEHNYALVGNRIVKSNTLMVTDTSNEVYYNLDIICTLLGNVSLERLARSNTLYVCSSIQNEVEVATYGSSGNSLGNSYVVAIDIDELNDTFTEDGEAKGCYNIDNLEVGTNVLTRKFNYSVNGKDEAVYVIVEYDYVLPDDEVLASSPYTEIINKIRTEGSEELTLQDVNNLLYTRPSADPKLQDWWDSNISVGNSLANFMYGTTGVEYVQTGFLAPSLTILRGQDVSDAAISSIFTQNGFKLDTLGLKYCNSTTKWWEQYYSGNTMSDDYLKALAFTNRVCKIINAKAVSDGNIYDTSYFVSKAGVIYRNVRDNPNVYYRNNVLKLKTRNVSGRAKILAGTKFTYGGKEWLYQGTFHKDNKTYYGVQPLFDDDFRMNSVAVSNLGERGIVPIYSNDDLDASANAIWMSAINNMNHLYESYFGYSNFLYGGSKKPVVSDGISANLFVEASGDMYRATNADVLTYFKEVFGSNFFVNENVLTNGQVSDNIPSKVPQLLHGNKEIIAVPIFYLDTTEFYFYGNNENYYLNKGPLVKALNVDGIFTVGISKCVRDSIIYKYTKTLEINKLIENQVVTISDVTFKRVASSNAGSPIFVSEPINNVELVNALMNSSNQDEKLNIVKNTLFAGIQVNYGGRNYYLSSYIKNAFIGELYNPNKAANVLYSNNGRQGGSLRVYVDDTATNQDPATTMPQSVCIAIQLEDGLFARPTTLKQNTYVALLYSPVTIDSSVDNIPFSNEALSFYDDTISNVTVEHSKFYPSELFKMTKNRFKKMQAKAFAGDIVTIIWMFIFYIMAYLAIISWVMFAVLTKGYAYKIFEVLTVPSYDGRRKGFDLIKILTFGIYNINSEPTAARTFISSFVYFFISYAIVIWQPM